MELEQEILAALIEWREARLAFFIVPPVTIEHRFPPEIWRRLANAEFDLIEAARKIT
jgi:hypothetical protein